MHAKPVNSTNTPQISESPEMYPPNQSPSATSPIDSMSSSTSNECCFGKIWSAICNFFKCICPCLFGSSKQGTQKSDRHTQVYLAAGVFLATYRDLMKTDQYMKVVTAFSELSETDVKWQIIFEMMREKNKYDPKHMRLGQIKTYIRTNSEMTEEVCVKLKISSLNDFLEGKTLRRKFIEFLNDKVGDQAAKQPAGNPPQKGGQVQHGKPKEQTFKPKPATAVESFFAAGDQRTVFFSSKECGPNGRKEILLHLAEIENYDGVHTCLIECIKKNETTNLEILRAVGVDAIGVINTTHQGKLLSFLESWNTT